MFVNEKLHLEDPLYSTRPPYDTESQFASTEKRQVTGFSTQHLSSYASIITKRRAMLLATYSSITYAHNNSRLEASWAAYHTLGRSASRGHATVYYGCTTVHFATSYQLARPLLGRVKPASA